MMVLEAGHPAMTAIEDSSQRGLLLVGYSVDVTLGRVRERSATSP